MSGWWMNEWMKSKTFMKCIGYVICMKDNVKFVSTLHLNLNNYQIENKPFNGLLIFANAIYGSSMVEIKISSIILWVRLMN